MLFRDVIELISVNHTEDDLGGDKEAETKRFVFANKKSVRQTEFYDAQAAGLNPRLMFEIRTIEYQEEENLLHEGKEYKVVRSYDKNGELTELVCSLK